MTQSAISSASVHKIAQLANIPVTSEEEQALSQAFTETLAVVARMSGLNTQSVTATYQVTGLENVLRDDKVDEGRMLSQTAALANAQKKYNGYFVVEQVIDQD